MRSKKATQNLIMGLIRELVMIICGFILPHIVLANMGSDYNGITSVVKQFLNVISLLQAGIGTVSRAALYKPLAKKNNHDISVIVKTTENFMHTISYIYIGATLSISVIIPLFIREFNYFFVASLVLIMSLSTFAQYFFGFTYQLLLDADQRQRYIYVINSVKIIVNTALSAILINAGFGIHAVMLGSSIIYVVAPIFVFLYVKKKYAIDKSVKTDYNVLKQRWDNFGLQVSYFITANTDLVVLSMFSTLSVASVYTVYNMIVAGLFGLFTPIINVLSSSFGNMLAKEEHILIKKNVKLYEQVVFALASFLFGVTSVVILPFVDLYTKNTKDVITTFYLQPAFVSILLAAMFFRAGSCPYESITQAAGHFRPNRNPAFIEAGINISVSITLAIFLPGYGKLIGVAIGTLLAYAFRTIRYAIYFSKNIVPRSIWLFIRRIIISLSLTTTIAVLPHILPFPHLKTWTAWVVYATAVSLITGILIIAVEFLFYRNDLVELIRILKYVSRKKPSAPYL